MAALIWRKKVLLAKIEATSGTAEAPGAAADAILATDVELTPIAGDSVSRELDRAHHGASPTIPTGVHAEISFSVEYASSGAAGTAPAWGKLLRACGMSETVAAGATVTYVPVSASEPSLTIVLLVDGTKQVLAGCRGTWSLDLTPGQVPRIRFTFRGSYADPSDEALPTDAAYAAWKDPVPVSDAGTPTFELHGETGLVMSAASIEYGSNVVWRDAVGANEAVITGREVTGQLTIDAVTVATLAAVKRARDRTTGALKIVHGVGAGKIIELSAPKVELGTPSSQESDGIWQMQAPIVLLPNADAGNDEIKIVAK